MEKIKWFLNIVVPRFITEYVVLVEGDDCYYPLCSAYDLDEWEFDKAMAFQKWRSFNFFGRALFPKPVGGTWQLDSFYEIKNLP